MKLNDETSVWIKQYGLTPLISKFHEFRWKFFPKFPNFSVNNLRELKTASFPLAFPFFTLRILIKWHKNACKIP